VEGCSAGAIFRAAEEKMSRCLGWVERAVAVPRWVAIRWGLCQAVQEVSVSCAEA
jgi:hypothetical protein